MSSKETSNRSNGWTAEPGQNLQEKATNAGLDNDQTNHCDQTMDMEIKTFMLPDPISWDFDECLQENCAENLTGMDHEISNKLSDMAMSNALDYNSKGQKVEFANKLVLALSGYIAQDVCHNIHKKALHLTDDQKKNLAENLLIFSLAEKDYPLMTKVFSTKLKESPIFHTLLKKKPDLRDVIFLGLKVPRPAFEGDESDQNHKRKFRLMGLKLKFEMMNDIQTVKIECIKELSSFFEKLDGKKPSDEGTVTDADSVKIKKKNKTVDEAKKAGLNNEQNRIKDAQLLSKK